MKFYIGAIPFFDARMTVSAYRLVSQRGDKLLGAALDFRLLGASLATPALDLLERIGIEAFAGDSDLFIDVSKYQLLMGVPANLSLPRERIICVIDESMLSDEAVISKLTELKAAGYRLALEGLPEGIEIENLLNVFECIILKSSSKSFTNSMKKLRSHLFKFKFAVTDIPDRAVFDSLAGYRNILLSGDFYTQPITRGAAEISPIKMNALNLLRQINSEDFDLTAAAGVIERDPALSISLLRFINSISTGREKRIDSIRNAVAILGQKEVKKWATVAISVSIGEDRPGEITRLSLIRAKFAENLASAFEMGMLSGSLFIAGLFSLLDVILEKPMNEAINEVAVDEPVRQALVEKGGSLYEVLSLIFAYERANWDSVAIQIVRREIDIESITGAYIDALMWYKRILESIDSETD